MRMIGKSLCVLGLLTSALTLAGQSLPEKQIEVDAVPNLLAELAFFQPDDLKELYEGKIVVKAIPTKDKQIVSILGVVKLMDISAASLDDFRASLTQRSNKTRTAGSKFSVPPTVDDLENLELEDKDFKVLKKCSVGDCDMNLSAEMIKKISREIDWAAADHKERMPALFREMLLRYVSDYTARGDRSLGQYSNRKEPVDLAVSHKALLSDSIFLTDLSPEIIAYFTDFPNKELNGATSEMHWSTVDFGLKPAITLTHTVAFDGSQNGLRRLIVANKQIYASRYLDASLSFAMLVSTGGNESGGYLIFADRSQSDALDGLLGGLARGVVENEGVEKVRGLLKNAELRLIVIGQSNTEQRSSAAIASAGIMALLRSPLFLAATVAILGAAIILFFRRRR